MPLVISDTSCLILYHKLEKLDILGSIFSSLYITEQVAEEYGEELPDWISIVEIKNRNGYLELRKLLGQGEASSIILAEELTDSLLIIDEKRGRKVAKEKNLNIIGSLGILLLAKEKGIINSVRENIIAIEQTNFRISQKIKQQLLKLAREE